MASPPPVVAVRLGQLSFSFAFPLFLSAFLVVSQAAPWPMMLQDPSHQAKLGQGLSLSSAAPALKWKYQAGGEVESSVVVGNKLVYSAAGKRIFALDRETGSEVWSFAAQQNILASGALAGGVFMVGADDHFFYALAEDTGKLLWKFEAGEAGEFTGGATVGEEEGVVYVGSGDEQLHAYFLNGTKRFSFEATAPVCSTPALDKTGIYFGDDFGRFFKLDRATGKQIWRQQFPANIRAPARLEPDGIFLSIGDPDESLSGEILRLGYDGSTMWRSDCGRGGRHKCGSCWTAPAVVGDVVIGACGLDSKSEGFIWGLEKDSGKVRWKVQTGNDCQTSSPMVVGDAVVVGCTDGKLYAIGAQDGARRWHFEAQAGIWTTPAMDEHGTIFIGSHDGYVYALEGTRKGGHDAAEM
ncbi:unnamed protein product [Polarella glacialis]|uniref:Pyrrolo-quinoline quinone repeat domain-containing protein n=1 Tax=Polarella glacialis TaxID=89957 RepID=A0A813J5C6_POLGL|nr:unnamed protein product [Polarella glacialis]